VWFPGGAARGITTWAVYAPAAFELIVPIEMGELNRFTESGVFGAKPSPLMTTGWFGDTVLSLTCPCAVVGGAFEAAEVVLVVDVGVADTVVLVVDVGVMDTVVLVVVVEPPTVVVVVAACVVLVVGLTDEVVVWTGAVVVVAAGVAQLAVPDGHRSKLCDA
jgi:hypothetical protein